MYVDSVAHIDPFSGADVVDQGNTGGVGLDLTSLRLKPEQALKFKEASANAITKYLDQTSSNARVNIVDVLCSC